MTVRCRSILRLPQATFEPLWTLASCHCGALANSDGQHSATSVPSLWAKVAPQGIHRTCERLGSALQLLLFWLVLVIDTEHPQADDASGSPSDLLDSKNRADSRCGQKINRRSCLFSER